MFSANITRDEALRRASHLKTHSYRVEIDLSNETADAAHMDPKAVFWSRSTVRFTTDGEPNHLDLIADQLIDATLDGTPLPEGCFHDEVVSFDAAAGDHELTVTAWCHYSHTGEGLHRFADPVDGCVYVYTQLETADARRVYACFEQPNLKATFELSVTVPASWTVLSNSPTPEPTTSDAGKRFDFAPTPPISTYITAVVAGPFELVHDSHPGQGATIPLTLACRASLAPYLDAKRLFALTRRGFGVFERAFGRPYPFEHYAQVFVPEFNAGAMENAGCVTIRDEYLYRSRMTNASYEARDNTILHELAHMWFGDLVTMSWWDDLWLNESFAEWASHFAQAEIRKTTGTGDDPWATFSNSRKTWAYRQDQLPSTHPIAADMVDLEAVELNFDGITYAKGASVLRQLVAFVGQDAFLAGVRAYFAAHAWGNTCLNDLLGALQQASGRDLSTFADQWLRTCGVNTLRAQFEVDDAGAFTEFTVRQSAANAWPVLRRHRLAVGLYDHADGRLTRVARVETDIDGEATDVPELVGRTRPALILLNDDDLTYAKIRLDDRSTETLVHHLHELDDALARALCWGAAWDMCRDGELSASVWIDLVLRGVATETDLTAVGSVLAQARTAIDYYTPTARRAELNTRFGHGIATLLKQAKPGSDHQLAFARAFIDTATSPAGVEVLRAWLRADEAPTGLAIDTDLRWRAVTRLVALGEADEHDIDLEAAHDSTAQGAEKAAGARAAQPTAMAKQAAWRLATTDSATVANETHFQVCSQFWQFGQREVLSAYVDAYLRVVEAISDGRDGWSHRSSAIRQHVLNLLFPRPFMDRDWLDTVQRWFAARPLADAVHRPVAERIDDAERALRCQAAFAQDGTNGA